MDHGDAVLAFGQRRKRPRRCGTGLGWLAHRGAAGVAWNVLGTHVLGTLRIQNDA